MSNILTPIAVAKACIAALAEQLAYQKIWYTDIRFSRDCYLGLSVIAGATKQILLGPGVTDPYTKHPAMTAATLATLDELSDGRAILGLGAGDTGFGNSVSNASCRWRLCEKR
ncbi:MAG: hypothetical protein CMO26_02685 [Thiotrichales bacterium]|nr:hypothetical protein [Thiotrichales bacterium]